MQSEIEVLQQQIADLRQQIGYLTKLVQELHENTHFPAKQIESARRNTRHA